jgi:hypothetical protein
MDIINKKRKRLTEITDEFNKLIIDKNKKQKILLSSLQKIKLIKDLEIEKEVLNQCLKKHRELNINYSRQMYNLYAGYKRSDCFPISTFTELINKTKKELDNFEEYEKDIKANISILTSKLEALV